MTKRQILAFLFGMFVLVGLISIAISTVTVQRIQMRLTQAQDFHTESLYKLLQINDGVTEAVQEGFAYVLSGEAIEKREFMALQALAETDLSAFRRIARLDDEGEEAERLLFEEIVAGRTALTGVAERMFSEYENTGGVTPLTFQRYEAIVDELGSALDRLIAIEEQEVDAAQARAVAVIRQARQFLLLQGLIVLGAALIAALVAARVLSRVFAAREALEEQLRQSQKMDAVGQLAGGIAHDFNNYLTVIGGAANLLAQGNRQDADYWAKQIIDATERSSALTAQLLAFARKQVSEPRAIDINAVVDRVTPLLERTIGEHVTLEIFTDPSAGVVEIDPAQLEQIIVNLVLNGRDALPDGGTITVETGQALISDEYLRDHPDATPGAHAMLAVSDNGTGIASEVRDRLFEPFVTTKPVGEGSGLGLSTVYGIVRQSGGVINVYSESGKGTTFRVYLPQTESAGAAMSAPAGAQAVSGEGKILLVEDDVMVRQVARAMLESFGFDIVEAVDGVDGLAKIVEHKDVRLLLTDVTMPRMSGIELASQARRLVPGLKVLFMSGYTQNGIVHQGRVDPGHTLLQKPFTIGELSRKLNEALRAETGTAAA